VAGGLGWLGRHGSDGPADTERDPEEHGAGGREGQHARGAAHVST
jgi:hypothetical protein